MKGIEIIKDITFNEDTMYEQNYKVRDIIQSDEPYSGLNEDGTFTVCFGMVLYNDIPKEYFKIIEIKENNVD